MGPPLLVVAVARIRFVPAVNGTLTVTVRHVDHAPVPSNATPAATVVPFTAMFIGRFVVVPLAYRNVTCVVAAVADVTVNSTALPTTLL